MARTVGKDVRGMKSQLTYIKKSKLLSSDVLRPLTTKLE